MQSLFWHLANRTAETQFIFNLFHGLLAGLTLLVLLHQLRVSRKAGARAPDWLLALGFVLLVLHFAVRTLRFGAEFFFRKESEWPGFEPVTHGLLACGLLLVVAAFLEIREDEKTQAGAWTVRGCGVVAGAMAADTVLSLFPSSWRGQVHSAALLFTNLIVLLAVALCMRAIFRSYSTERPASLIALASLAIVVVLQIGTPFLPGTMGVLIWNAEQHVMSISLFAFAWVAGERSGSLLHRVFVRLNLTFIILASLIMLLTVSMEKYQYLRLAEERSMNLAEFLRGHIIYYQAKGESLEDIFRHSEVMRRVVVEFGTLPELREIDIYLDGRRASFQYTRDWEIKEEIISLPVFAPRKSSTELANRFEMIRLPIGHATDNGNRIEFWGTMDYINAYIGKYIALIYSLFTIVVLLATSIIGIIVSDADRRLRRQYAELQETHQQLAQAAKLASVGELAGGMAHEINTPITSILSLASHLAEEKATRTLAPRQRKSLELIAQQAERVAKIVGNLLTFSRQAHLELSRVDVAELLETAITLVAYRLKDSTFVIRREFDGDLPIVLGDAGRLTEVFVNLLNNAVDAMPDGGTLILRAFTDPDGARGVRAEVTDTGCGIPPENLPRIFDPFFTTKESGRGTGLGLSISHGIVKDHGGQICVQSQPGVGTKMVVVLPKGGEFV